MEDMPSPQPAPAEHTGEGTISAIGADGVTLSHGPIESVPWPAMTMQFRLAAPDATRALETGQSVRFAFAFGDDGMPRVTSIEPLAGAPQ